MDGRLFGLDMQLVFDVCVMFVFLMLLYVIMSNLFFKPVRAFMEKRKAAIDADREEAVAELEAADKLKAEYEGLLKAANKEAEGILSASYKEAVKQQEEIIAQAKIKAAAIAQRAQQEADDEVEKVKDEVKAQMSEIAGMMAGQFITSVDPFREAMLLEETLKEMGGEAWKN